jgi:hypothetical protein
VSVTLVTDPFADVDERGLEACSMWWCPSAPLHR